MVTKMSNTPPGIQFAKAKISTPLKKIVLATVLLNIFSLLFVLAVQKNLPPQIPLYYGLPEGDGQLATPFWLITPAIFSLAVFLVNILISSFWKNEFLQQTLTLTSLAIAILSAITTLKIAVLVGSF